MVYLRAHRLFANALRGHRTEDFGHPMVSKTNLTKQVTTYFRRTFQSMFTPSVGQGANDTDAIADARRMTGNETVRATIAHMDFVSEEDAPRFAALNVTAQTSIQWARAIPLISTLAILLV